MASAVVVIGGVPAQQVLPPSRTMSGIDTVIAADSGYDLAVNLGLQVDLLVGDMDSISAAGLEHAEARGVAIVRYGSDKESTDLELALDAALDRADERIVVIGGEGGRFDHLVGNVSVLTSPRFAHLAVEAWIGRAYAAIVRGRWSAALRPGACLSVLPWGGAATVAATGVKWPLGHELLAAGTSRGISNEALGGEVEIEVDDGLVMVLVPDAEEFT